jgi:hypothetical protein
LLEILAAHASNKLVEGKLEVNMRRFLELGVRYLQKGSAKRTKIFLAACVSAESLECVVA